MLEDKLSINTKTSSCHTVHFWAVNFHYSYWCTISLSTKQAFGLGEDTA